MLEKVINHILENDKNKTEKQIETIEVTEDEVEKEILKLKEKSMEIREFSKFINKKHIVEKKIGIQIVNQLLRDNNLFDTANSPLDFKEGYFNLSEGKVLLTKKGMIKTYQLIKEQITEDYQVRR